MPPVLPVLRVAGPGRNVGKTWLACRLIEAFTQRGYAVGAIKRSHHPLPPDKPGSDTDLFARAGALAVTFGTAAGTQTRSPRPATSLSALVDDYVGRADIVIVEGFKDDALGAVAWIDRPAREGDPGRVLLRSMDGKVLLDTPMDGAAAIVAACEERFGMSSADLPARREPLRRAARAHGTRCHGVTLGTRMALAGLDALGIVYPVPDRRVLVHARAVHCIVDAIAAVTGCSIGARTLLVEDAGELSADFLDQVTGRAVRIATRASLDVPLSMCGAGLSLARRRALDIACHTMSDSELFTLGQPALSETSAG